MTVTDVLPAGLTYVGPASSNGWAIAAAGQQVTATRADVLGGSNSYPVLTLAVSVANHAPADVTNGATVSGGGDITPANDTSSDLTAIIPTVAVTITEFSTGISASRAPYHLTAGPDGNIWFTEISGNRIGRITPRGPSPSSRQASLPTATSGASRPVPTATSGSPRNRPYRPDHALRAASPSSASAAHGLSDPLKSRPGRTAISGSPSSAAIRIGRITPQGSVTEFSTGISAQQPHGITAGPDGNLWFTEQFGRIGRITPQGSVTEFSTGISANSQPAGITAGPDGNLWFTQPLDDHIGRITPQGTVSEFSAGITAGGFTEGITAGPDGNLWFSEINGSASAVSRPGERNRVQRRHHHRQRPAGYHGGAGR